MANHAFARAALARGLVLLAVGVLSTFTFASDAGASPLVDGRMYEVVSPVDKNGGDIVGDGQMTLAARDGDGVAYASRVGFGDTTGSGLAGMTQYVAFRAPDGWKTRAITPTPDQGTVQVFIFTTTSPWFSDDLRTALVFAYDLPRVSGDAPGVSNVYEENTLTGALLPLSVSQADPLSFIPFFSSAPWAASSDLGHVLLVSGDRMLPNAPVGTATVYEWVGGSLRIASVLPDGSIASNGADVQPRPYRNAVSADGSHVVFVSPDSGNSQLYVRINGTRTDWVSQPEATVDPGQPTDVALQWVSDDGRHILFTTSSRLLDTDTNDGPDVYRYDESSNPASNANLTLISNAGNVSGTFDGTAVVGASQDASRIYYQDQGNHLWLWDHGATKLVSNDVPRSFGFQQGTRLSATDADPGASRLTPDGDYLAFMTNATQNNDHVHGLTGQVTNHHLEMYLYHAQDNTLACISCPQGRDATADVSVVPAATLATATVSLPGARPRFLSSDGRRVFFSTSEALVPQDTNGVPDVYEYDTTTRRLALISTGQGSDGAWFADASESGSDVFFVTRQQLVRQDRDSLVDLYDARVGGGFPDGPAPRSQCIEDACQGPLLAAPGQYSIGSEDLSAFGSTTRASLFVRVAHAVRGSHGRLIVRASASGRLRLTGVGIQPGAYRLRAGRSYRIPLVLTSKARRWLRRRAGYRVTLTLSFRPEVGASAKVSAAVTFKSVSSRKGR